MNKTYMHAGNVIHELSAHTSTMINAKLHIMSPQQGLPFVFGFFIAGPLLTELVDALFSAVSAFSSARFAYVARGALEPAWNVLLP